MFEREKFHWIVELQNDQGEMSERHMAVYWDPTWDDARDAVMRAAKAEAHVASGPTGYRRQFAPISATRIERPGPMVPEGAAA